MTTRKYFDLAIIAPLEEEFETAVSYFEFVTDLSTSKLIRFHVQAPNSDLNILLVKQNAMGKTSAQEATLSAVTEFEIGCLACVGIAGALSNDLNIGDVCYSGLVVDVLDNNKASERENEPPDLAFSPTFYETPRELTVAVSLDRLLPNLKLSHATWSADRGQAGRSKIPGEFHGKDGKFEKIENPKVVEGSIACGAVSGSPQYNAKLKAIDRKILGIETEAGGVFFIAKNFNIPAVVFRGISDYAGIDKNRFELETNNKARHVAASNVFSFVSYQLGRPKFSNYIRALSTSAAAAGDLFVTGPEQDLLATIVLRLTSDFHEKLRDLAPGFSLQSKGYRLPVPRIKFVDQRVTVTAQDEATPSEIRDAFKTNRVLIINVPKQYPDASLPWIIASDLLRNQTENTQFVPYVITGSAIKSVTGSLDRIIDEEVAKLYNRSECKLIFIIDDFKFETAKRASFLADEISKWPDACFLLVSRYHGNLISETNFVAMTSAKVAEICDVSFIEIAHFLQKNFELTGPASEVIATRLRETFENFDLSAHPTYFAGLPRNTLDALLQANRRAELIQIAVVGYLSFLVASEDESADVVSLSRTTREEFLTDLAVAINVRKQSYSEADLVAHVERLAREKDFKISASQFIHNFINKGILHIEAGRIRFSLQFMESFLLAKYLVIHEIEAASYFDVGEDDFDYQTFTLYAEMGPAESFLGKLKDKLRLSTAELKARRQKFSILSGDLLQPAILTRQDRLVSLQKQLQRATNDVRDDRDASHDKQKLLDATDRVREGVARKQDKLSASTEEERQKKYSVERAALAAFLTAAQLLGSGAERLNAENKRAIISDLVQLSTLIIEDWTHLVYNVDFKEYRKEILKQEDILDELRKRNEGKNPKEAENLLASLVDLLEYAFLMQPFRAIVGSLCEEARNVILAESIANVKFDGNLDNLIRNMWLADIDTKRGRILLLDSIKRFPKAKFLRVAVSSHLIERVYWKHWKKDDRLSLLDVAQQSLQIIGKAFNSFEIKRMIDSKNVEDPLEEFK